MDLHASDPGDIFEVPDLWAPSSLLDVAQHSGVWFADLNIHNIDETLPELSDSPQRQHPFFKVPELSSELLQAVPASSQLTWGAKKDLQLLSEHKTDADIWLSSEEVQFKPANFHSWDGFNSHNYDEVAAPYITEAVPSIFDAALASTRDYLNVANEDYVLFNSKAYFLSLVALVFGRSSILFAWHEEKNTFIQVIPKLRISGFTGETLDSLLTNFLECGNITRYLQRFVEKSYAECTSPGRIALADSVSILLATIQSELGVSASQQKSLLLLQDLFRPVHLMLKCFQRMIMNTVANRSDESLLSTIFEEIQILEHRTDSLRDILLEILSRVSQPWLEFASEWIGLQKESGLPITKNGAGKSFVRVENKELVEHGIENLEPDYLIDYDKVPSFIAPEDARVIFEVGKSLRFLRDHHPDHPLAKVEVVESVDPPPLEWKFSWQDFVEVEANASHYEENLKAAIENFTENSPADSVRQDELNLGSRFFEFLGNSEETRAHVMDSTSVLGLPLQINIQPNRLATCIKKHLTPREQMLGNDESIFLLPVSLSPMLSFRPIVAAQARIVNGTCMRIFFKSHRLREHLTLQRSFYLLGNGVFSSRLSHALFDTELESAERHRGFAQAGGAVGLRLGGRDNWPPASYELQLALMSVLTECYVSSEPLTKSLGARYLEPASLPGDLSFAVRDMSEEEIDACMDPDGISALDFLRLSYKPPTPLEAIITPLILFKYDQLFKLLLRVLRMRYVVSTLTRSTLPFRHNQISSRFRIEAHHFISSICAYFFDTGIGATWHVFELKLDEIEKRINEGDFNLGSNEGLDKLRDYHEKVVDRIMFALFLRKRQLPVLALLEEIFQYVLLFSKWNRRRVKELYRSDEDEDLRGLYRNFRKKVGVFVNVCRGLSDKKGYGEKRSYVGNDSEGGMFDGDDLVDENTVFQLLNRLEMSGYYSQAIDL